MTSPRFTPVIALLSLLPLTAAAEPPDRLDTADGAIPMDPPVAPPASLDSEPDTQRLGDKIMFVNFDGADMNQCGNNSPQNNCSTIFGGVVEPYTGDAAKRATVIQIVRTRTEDFGITVTDTRPASGDYDMEMVGDWQGAGDTGFAGVAPSIDCFDQRGGETSFTLEASGTSDGIAEIILQEIAHTWGLEHINDQGDLLYPTTQGQNKVFKDECIKIVADTELNPSNGRCNAMHTNFCQSGWQNSYQELLQLFGPAIADTQPPLVEIISPADGDVIEGGELNLVVRFEDNLTPVIINASILIEGSDIDPVEEDGAYAGPSELEFPIMGLPDGQYTVSIDATDESDNPASDSVSFEIISDAPADDSGDGDGDGDSGDGDGDGDSGNDSGADDDDSDDDDGDDDDEGSGDDGGAVDDGAADRGCACRSTSGPPLHAGLLALLGLGAIRRRRSANV